MTEVKPETVSIYQVKRTEKDSYKKRSNWRLKDLKHIDGKDETNVRADVTLSWLEVQFLQHTSYDFTSFCIDLL